MLKVISKTVKRDFVIIDSLFPQKEPFSFRNTEINEYLYKVKNSYSYTMSPMKPGKDAWFSHSYGMTSSEFENNKKGYLKHYPQNIDRISYLDRFNKYRFQLAYSFFLAETYTLLPFYEKYKIPFVFVLYPGGSFGINNNSSDKMLQRIFGSKYFKAVIVTQEITQDYLINKELCSRDKIFYIYGGFVQFKAKRLSVKKYYKKDKQDFDICFVAAKYSEKGVDKGYDLFIESAKKIAAKIKDARFHVVGGFSEDDISVAGIKSKIKFYGYRRPDFLSELYSRMDIFLSPGRPFQLYEGNFDGFPLGIDAGYCGTALFVSDELKMNRHYINKKNIIIIPLNANKIAANVIHYYNNLEELYSLSHKGRQITQKLFDIDYQIAERLKVFSRYTSLDI